MLSQYILITGASSGIGLEFARISAAKGFNQIWVARNAEKLTLLKTEFEATYAVGIQTIVCDLSRHNAVDSIVSQLDQWQIVPDILINNAGFGTYGPFNQTDFQTEKDMLQVNVVTLTELTKVIYSKMRERNSGYILNLASVAGFMPGPLMAVYYASKAYVLSFSEALANEAKGSNVHVTVLCPGPTIATNFVNKATLQNSRLFKGFGKLPTAKQVAAYGWKSMMKGKATAVHGWKNRCMIFLIRLVPRKMVMALVRYKQRLSKNSD